MIDRRRFLQHGLLAAWWPMALAGATPRTPPSKPLLVVVPPDDDPARRHLGAVLDALLDHGGDELLAAFALCEPACVPGRPVTFALIEPTVPARFVLIPPAGRAFDLAHVARQLIELVVPDRAALVRYVALAEAAHPGIAEIGACFTGMEAATAPSVVALAAMDGAIRAGPAQSTLAEVGLVQARRMVELYEQGT